MPDPRPATPEDIGALRRLAERAYLTYVPRIGRKPAPMVADFAGHVDRGEVYVLAGGSGLAGYIVTFEAKGAQFVENVAVDPARRGQGLGRRLMAFAEDRARAAGLGRLWLYTNARMTENRDFYISLGYRVTGRRREAGFDRVYLEKDLA